jgi:hypothetical protein
LIEGKGIGTGGTELIETDRLKQCKLAIDALSIVEAKTYLFIYGTPYHTGHNEDFEDTVAEKFKAKIQSQLFLSVNDLKFHFKHFISNSTIPHGKFTMLARAKMWNMYWSEISTTPHCDIFVRSHRHGLDYCGGSNWLALTTPGLQGWGSKFGERLVERTIDFGFVYFDIRSKDDWDWEWRILGAKLQPKNLMINL